MMAYMYVCVYSRRKTEKNRAATASGHCLFVCVLMCVGGGKKQHKHIFHCPYKAYSEKRENPLIVIARLGAWALSLRASVRELKE